jgi:hypothetical protein
MTVGTGLGPDGSRVRDLLRQDRGQHRWPEASRTCSGSDGCPNGQHCRESGDGSRQSIHSYSPFARQSLGGGRHSRTCRSFRDPAVRTMSRPDRQSQLESLGTSGRLYGETTVKVLVRVNC